MIGGTTVKRGEIWWADLGEPQGSGPGFRRPVLIVQSNLFNQSRIRTVVAIVLTTNLDWADAPGNVLLPAGSSGLARDSVANVTQIVAVDRDFLLERVGRLEPRLRAPIDAGIRRVLGL